MATVENPTIEPVTKDVRGVAQPAPATTPPKRRRFTVDEYYKMAEVGILNRDERVELLDGEIIVMCPMGSRHSGHINRLNSLLVKALDPRCVVAVQLPVRIGKRSEPEPDLSLLKPRTDFYESAHPGPDDVLFLIEVMDSSAKLDRGRKLRLYARHGIREVWRIDLKGGLIEIHRGPLGETYKEKRTVARGETLSPEAFPDVVLEVNAILGEHETQ